MLRMCVLTVFSETDSLPAISGLDRFVGRCQLQIVTRGQHRVNVRGKFVSRRAVTGTRNSAIQGDGNSGPEPAYSRLSVVDLFCGAPVARITVIR